MPCIPKKSFTTHQARCLVSVSERLSLFSFSLLSLMVESVIHVHGLSDRRYLLLFELKHNNKQQMNLQIWFWSVEQLISRPWLLLIAIAISCLRFDKCPGFNFLTPLLCRTFLFSYFPFSISNVDKMSRWMSEASTFPPQPGVNTFHEGILRWKF